MIPYSSRKFIFSRFRKMGMVLLSFAFFFDCALAPSRMSKQEDTTAQNPSTPPNEIRILTINVWSGLTYRGFFKIGEYQDNPKKRYELLVSRVRKLSPDVIAIQEANPLPDYAKRLATDLDYEAIYDVALGGIRFGPLGIPTNMREGNVILVKKPWTLASLGKKRLSGNGVTTNWFCLHFDEITQSLLGRAVIKGKPLYLYTVHLHEGPFHGSALDEVLERLAREMTREKVEEAKNDLKKDADRRSLEVANLKKFVMETLPPDTPAIILGDFNTTIDSGELKPLFADGKWADSFQVRNPGEEGVTWDPKNNPNFRHPRAAKTPYDVLHAYHDSHSYRIDFILVGGNIPRDHILESRVVMTPVDGFSVSDHYGVLTTLKW